MKIKCTLTIGLLGCEREFEIEVDDEDLEGRDEQARETLIWDEMVDVMWRKNLVELTWEEKA